MTSPASLNRLVEFDQRSRNYPIRELLEAAGDTTPRSYTWKVPVRLDQGQDGACVGFSWAQEAAARPVEVPNVDNALALSIYHRAQQLDQWPGEAYSGTSVLAGAKAMQERGWLDEYRWAFNLEDALLAISRHGPAVLGIWWWDSMFHPDKDGFVTPKGTKAGGHAILCNGVNVKSKYVILTNSWGADWGQGGSCKVSWDDLGKLLADDGECCIPVKRSL